MTERAEAISAYSAQRKSGWKVLSFGTMHGGKVGAVHLEDQNGDRGYVVQDHVGASFGTIIGIATDYRACASELTHKAAA